MTTKENNNFDTSKYEKLFTSLEKYSKKLETLLKLESNIEKLLLKKYNA